VLERSDVRRKIDAVVYEVRKEMAKVALEMADKNGEPVHGDAADRWPAQG
jgi:hypothetical protein